MVVVVITSQTIKSKTVNAGACTHACVIKAESYTLSIRFWAISYKREDMIYFIPFFYYIAVPSLWRQ
jgi:hypothetical protein